MNNMLARYEPSRISLNGKRYDRCSTTSVSAMHPKFDLTGQRFGRLLVMSRASSSNGFSVWNCVCDCGNPKTTRGVHLRKGETVSCGCYHKEIKTIHGRRANQQTGQQRDATYLSFIAMKGRVLNPKNPAYHNYGGRGIKICSAWTEGGFVQFLKNMGNRPAGMSLDRIDNNSDYSPENCKWSNEIEQAANRRTSNILLYQGRSQCLSAWSRELNITRHEIYKGLNQSMTLEEIVQQHQSNKTSAA